ncbi:MAG: hypothetical protein ACJA1A_002105 [Saprospiraceae bacterium]|jgi:hypothetical protein
MKILITASFIFTLYFSITAQNLIPEVTILSSEIVEDVLNVEYLISDDDNSNFEVGVWLSKDAGDIYTEISEVIGDVGQVTETGIKLVSIDKTILTGEYQIRIVVDDLESIDVETIVNSVDSNSVKSYLEHVEGVRHHIANLPHLDSTRSYVVDHLDNMNLNTSIQYFPFAGGFTGQNLLGRDEGVQNVKGEYLVGGHYDTVDNSPGADDNGTAVAALMEIARVCKDYNFDHSVRYVSWDQEEAGLLGSAYYVNNLPENIEIKGYLNFEMLGYYSDKPNTQTLPAGFEFIFPEATQEVSGNNFRGDFLTNVGNGSNSNTIMIQFDSIAGEYVPELKVINLASPGNGISVPDLLRSDHAPFWAQGLPAVMLTDASEFRNPNYHTELDVIDSLDMNFLTNNVKAAVAYLAVKAGVNHKGFASIGSDIINSTISNEAWGNKIKVFPNPTIDLLNIGFETALSATTKVEILDMTGKIVFQDRISAGTALHQAPVRGLVAGRYFIKLESEGKVTTKGFVKGEE